MRDIEIRITYDAVAEELKQNTWGHWEITCSPDGGNCSREEYEKVRRATSFYSQCYGYLKKRMS